MYPRWYVLEILEKFKNKWGRPASLVLDFLGKNWKDVENLFQISQRGWYLLKKIIKHSNLKVFAREGDDFLNYEALQDWIEDQFIALYRQNVALFDEVEKKCLTDFFFDIPFSLQATE